MVTIFNLPNIIIYSRVAVLMTLIYIQGHNYVSRQNFKVLKLKKKEEKKDGGGVFTPRILSGVWKLTF